MKRSSKSDATVAPDDDVGAKGIGNAPTAAKAGAGCYEALQSTSEFIWQGHTGAVTSMLLLNGRLGDAKYAKPDPDDSADSCHWVVTGGEDGAARRFSLHTAQLALVYHGCGCGKVEAMANCGDAALLVGYDSGDVR